MTSEIHDPWSKIAQPETGFNVTRVDPEHPHNFFWGKDQAGSCLMLLEINKEFTSFLIKRSIDLKGVKTDIRHNESTEECFFVLTLQRREDSDIFYRLCRDLIEHTKKIKGQKTALEIIHTRLQRWKSFLSRKRSPLLTEHEIQGLYAELEFLKNLLSQNEEQLVVLEGWKGPLGGPHDFVLGNYAVEVKSTSKSTANSIRISSENQLVTHLDRLFLQVFSLAVFHDSGHGLSLNQIVTEVRNLIRESGNRDLFDNRLIEAGYMESQDYDFPCFSVTSQKTFEVRDGFPRITPDTIAEGLTNVSYDLMLSSLNDFKCVFPDDWR